MTDWIANGEAGSNVRAKLNLIGPLASGAISVPVSGLDFNLPTDSPVVLEIWNLFADVGGSLVILLSTDGGLTFLSSYKNTVSFGSPHDISAPGMQVVEFADVQGNFDDVQVKDISGAGTWPVVLTLKLYPGEVGIVPTMTIVGSGGDGNNPADGRSVQQWDIIATGASGPVNFIRLLGPPTFTDPPNGNLTNGLYSLRRI